jgi:RNA polymerase sigma-70 factor (sigma-E family)
VDAAAVTTGGRVAISEAEARGAGEHADSFAALFASERAPVLRFAYLLTGDVELAEEVVADAFASMYPRWCAGKVDEPARYLRRAVVNQVRGRFRRNATRRRFEAARAPTAPADPSDEGFAERERVRRALLTLPPGQRAVVALRYLDDRSEAETAALLGVSVGTVKSQAAHALERLRHALDDEGDA